MCLALTENYTGRVQVVSSFFLPEREGASNIRLIGSGDLLVAGKMAW